MKVLSAAFPGRWVVRGASDLWPPRSPDFTPIDIFFWGYVSNYVYMDRIRDVNHLKARIRECAGQVTRDMQRNLGKKWGIG
jgi:hypothetical protein